MWVRALTVAAVLVATVSAARAGSEEIEIKGYRKPSAEIVALLTASPPPKPIIHSASKRVALLTREAVVELSRLSCPHLGLAGFRFNPANLTSGVGALIEKVEIVSADPEREDFKSEKPVVWLPEEGGLFKYVSFSPDGRYLSALLIESDSTHLVLFDIEKRRARKLGTPINPAWGEPCHWLVSGKLLCKLVPAGQGAVPEPVIAPEVLEHRGGPAPVRTYSNTLRNRYDEELFEYYFTVELAWVSTDGTSRRIPKTRGLIDDFNPSPDGRLVVLTRIHKPYSHLVRASRFPSTVEVWDLEAQDRLYRSDVSGYGISKKGNSENVTKFVWKPGDSPVISWVEKGENEAGERVNRWMSREAPFAESQVVTESKRPISVFGWTSAGTPYFANPGEEPRSRDFYMIIDGEQRKVRTLHLADKHPEFGRALRVDGKLGPVLEDRGRLFLSGTEPVGGNVLGTFLDIFDIRGFSFTPVFRSEKGFFEEVLAILDPEGPVFLTSRESEAAPPALYVRSGDTAVPVFRQAAPYPQLQGVKRQVVSYQRSDGVALRGTLYLPAGHGPGKPLPTFIWIYPYEHETEEDAEQLDVRFFRYHRVRASPPLALVLAGYAVLVNPTVPIIGEGTEANDSYMEQLVDSVEAAADYLVDAGVSEPGRIAVGGHSYGAFSSANLIIHSDRFATAVLVSGAYNRTLTPFGFQHERRSFWDETRLYARISPFFQVDAIDRPVLLIHGSHDENPGTPPLQTRRFFHALVGEGVRARYVELPYEEHHFRGRENLLHAAAEIIDWLDWTIGNRQGVPAAVH
jgi:dipeptidyl aminopeptidase/acylaminoacyl peptidase